MKIVDGFAFFWKGYLNIWTNPGVLIEDKFPTAGHAYVYHKAMIFEDEETAKKILNTQSSKEVKILNQKIRGFSEEDWKPYREIVMRDVIISRARCDIKFRETITKILEDQLNKGFYDFKFVEANPYDTLWGVGLSENDPDILDPNNWKGKNLLGWCFTSAASWWLGESKLCQWSDYPNDECFYPFRTKKDRLKSIFLRWGDEHHWEVFLVPGCDDGWIKEYYMDCMEPLDAPLYEKDDLPQLKKWCEEKIKELDKF